MRHLLSTRPLHHLSAMAFLVMTSFFSSASIAKALPQTVSADDADAETSMPMVAPQPLVCASKNPIHPVVLYVTRLSHRDRVEDDKVVSYLERLGMTVNMVDETAPASDAQNTDLVIISSVVSARNMVGTPFREVAVPLVTWESDLFDSLRFTGERKDVDFGEVKKEHYVDIVNAPSALAGGVPAGKRWVYPRDDEMGWGHPGPGATIVATLPGEPDHAVVFAYEKGATMDAQFLAPARRVGLFLGNRTFEHLSKDGNAIVDASVRWALNCH